MIAYEFYSRYDTTKYSNKALISGGLPFMLTQHFVHPSYNTAEGQYAEIIVKRETIALVKIQQYAFTDTATFGGKNILHDSTDITEK
jgi:hypothetical protein